MTRTPGAVDHDALHVLTDTTELAFSVAARLTARIIQLQGAGTVPYVVLTGGRTGIAVLEAVRAGASVGSIDWSELHVFWGDDRWVPAGHPERNEKQAREALLDHVPVDPQQVHAMEPAGGRYGDDVEAAARGYAEVLAEVARPGQPLFDVCLLGVGEEGHVASIFPDSPAVRETRLDVVGVKDCPKPPPTRVSLTLPTISRSREVWLMTTGAAKARAVGAALAGASASDLPAAGAGGLERTEWFLDPAAAASLPGRERSGRRGDR
jgi:6-phosphogluconolactonase